LKKILMKVWEEFQRKQTKLLLGKKIKKDDGVSDPDKAGIFWDAPSDKSLHHSLCINNNVCAIGPFIAISIVFQPNFSVEKLPIMAVTDHISVFWNIWFQLFFQHDFHIPILSNVGGKFVSWENSRLCYNVYFWQCLHDCLCSVC